MKNTSDQIQVVKEKKSGEILGYILPGESCLLGREYLESKKIYPPEENPVNTVEV